MFVTDDDYGDSPLMEHMGGNGFEIAPLSTRGLGATLWLRARTEEK